MKEGKKKDQSHNLHNKISGFISIIHARMYTQMIVKKNYNFFILMAIVTHSQPLFCWVQNKHYIDLKTYSLILIGNL